MNLPIDARDAPFKQKYIDEETDAFARWMQFGTDITDDTAQVTDGQGNDVIIGLTREKARQLVAARKQFVDTVVWILNGDVQ